MKVNAESDSIQGRLPAGILKDSSILRSASQAVLALTLAACSNTVDPAPAPRVEAVTVQTPSAQPQEEPVPQDKETTVSNWHYEATDTLEVTLPNDQGDTLSAFIRSRLRGNGPETQFPSEAEAVKAILALAQKENRGKDVDHFLSIVNTEITLPSQIDLNYRSTTTFPDLATLDKLAAYDGFDLKTGTRATGQNRLVPMDKNPLPGLNHHGTDTPQMDGAALDQLSDAATRFTESTKLPQADKGWTLVYTDTTRAPQYAGDVHFTGLAVNVCASRFRDPDGREITWTDNPEERNTIENVLRPAEVRALLAAGAAIRDQVQEGGFYDAYFPTLHHAEIDYTLPKP